MTGAGGERRVHPYGLDALAKRNPRVDSAHGNQGLWAAWRFVEQLIEGV